MSSGNQIFQILTQILTALPIMLTCLIGIIFINRRQIAKNTKRAGILGLAVLLVDSVVGLAFNIFIYTDVFRDMAPDGNLTWIFRAHSLFSLLLYLVGLICLIIAICVKDNPRMDQQVTNNPYPPQ